jgi:hypothetical protein
MSLKLTKIARGWYATEDGTMAVIADGYEPGKTIGAEEGTGYEGFIAGEWAACVDPYARLREDHQAGSNLDWFDTKREAIDFLEDYRMEKCL